jgi:hypothetical protein
MNYDHTKFKVWTWKHPFMLHWMINPGLAINELLLGQKVPRVFLVEKDQKKSLAERTIIPCPHCQTLHPGLKWSVKNKTAFKNWFGLYCDHCKGIIPCLNNLTTLLILGISFPLWIWFRKSLKESWLKTQEEKFSRPLDLTTPEANWLIVGMSWGTFMYVFNTLLFPLLDNEPITKRELIVGIPIWIIGGVLFGLVMRSFAGKSKAVKKSKAA